MVPTRCIASPYAAGRPLPPRTPPRESSRPTRIRIGGTVAGHAYVCGRPLRRLAHGRGSGVTEPAIERRAYDGDQPTGLVEFTAMEHGTADDYALLDRYERVHAGGLPDRLLETLDRLTGSLGGYQITRLEHSLQTATRARLAGASTDWVVAALLHDIGDEVAPYNHSEYAAAVLKPYVHEEVHWTVLHHGVFQSYY